MAKNSELKFSIGKEERSLILISNFNDGYSSDFFFKLPKNFRDALDIKLTPRIFSGKVYNLYSQGKNFSFKKGDVIYDTQKAYKLKWKDALAYIKYCLQIVDSRDASTNQTESLQIGNATINILRNENDKTIEKDIIITKYSYNPGYVKFKLLVPDEKKEKLIEQSIYECSQENFVMFLQSGDLITKDYQHIKLGMA